MLLLGLSTSHKVGLALAAAGFAGFSLIVSMLVPRWRPQFPGRGLPLFLAVCVLMFFGMLAAVFVLGKESEPEAAGNETATQTTETGQAVQSVSVSEVDYKIRLPETTLKAGKYSFEVQNQGKVPHNLVIKGAGVDEATSDLAPGVSESLTVELKPGSYEFYCSIPGHKQLGMDQKVTVT